PKVLGVSRNGEIWRYPAINLAFAAASEEGLQLPVLKAADTLDMAARGTAWRALAENARQNRISPEDLNDGVIAISNLGNRGVENGTALLPPGMSVIVFFGSIEERPIAVNGVLEIRPTAHISATFDHRIIDGVTAAAFTSALRTLLSVGAAGVV
ncbi:MAG TPA: 2-oxo acid dehydrogenase subunit E2, partial [Rhizomicrobium sp.]|nr:2-oxo acid dehydrogenase subunit E2 [Rhizomicrobium sp.]